MFFAEAKDAQIPAIGFGTWELRGDVARHMVQLALEAGYRHIDTAQAYGNESEVGEAVRASHVPRSEIFLTTKVWWDRLRDGDLQRSVEESLQRLDMTYADLVLIHWPNEKIPLGESIAALCDVKARGLARHIGVSNFTVKLLDGAVAHADEPIVCNQVEYHPFLDQSKLLAACARHGMVLTAYSPLARGRVFRDPVLREIAAAHGKSPGQVAIRWLIQQPNVAAIPRSSSPANAAANNDVFDFALSREEMERITKRAEPTGRVVQPAWAPQWD